jgi:hypothetical protein
MENAGLHRRLGVFFLKRGNYYPLSEQATVVGASIITPETGGDEIPLIPLIDTRPFTRADNLSPKPKRGA